MADLERLVVSLDADITRLSKQLQKAGLSIDNFAKTADTKAGAAKDAINKHLSPGSGGLNTTQFQELASAGRHAFDALISGASPLRVLATEGTKASAAIGPAGLSGLAKQLGTSLGTVLTPARIATAGVAALGVAALYSYDQYEEGQRAIKTGLTGIGAASHATISDIEDIGEQVAATSRISVASARQIATAIAATGRVDVGNIGGIANLAKGWGNLTGKSTEDAGKELAKIFSDPAKGVDELNDRLGALDGKTTDYVRTLTEAGDRQQAIQVLLQAVQPDLLKAADNVGVLAKAWDALKSSVSSAGNNIGKGISNLVEGPSLDDQIADLQRQQNSYRPFASIFGDPGAADRAARLASLQAQRDARDQAQKDQANTTAAKQTSRDAEGAIEGADPDYEQIKTMRARLEQIGAQLANNIATPDIDTEGGIQHALDAYNSLDVKLKELQKDYEAGGRFAAQALRQADFQKATAGLSAYERGLAQVKYQYDQLIESARKDGDIRSLSTLTTAKSTAVEAYKRQTVEQAKAQIPVSSDLAKIIIGAEGNNAARNPASTASGIGQFLDSTFIDQFQKVFSDVAGVLRQQHTGPDGTFDQKGYDAAILANKNNVGINESLIQNYAHEIGLAITKAGYDGSDVRNQYLGYHFGPGGAAALLGANPNASAASVLGDKVTAANPGEVQGRTVQQLIDLIYERVQKNSSVGRAQQSQVVSAQASAQVYDQPAAQAARLQSIQEQLNSDREAGGRLGLQFATAQDLITASSDKLTPALQAQRTAILALGDARAKAAQTSLVSRFDTDQKNALDALGRTPEQQQVYTQAKTYGPEGSDPFNQAAAGLQKLQALNTAKAEGSTFTKGLVDDLIRGTTAGKALENQLQRIVSKLADSAIDSAFSSLFGSLFGSKTGTASPATGLFGSLFGGLGSLFHLASGGRVMGAGTSTSDSIPAMLSHGEYVVNARSASKNAGLLNLINSGNVMRFANGGMVGSLPAIPNASPNLAVGSGTVALTHAPTYNIQQPNGMTRQETVKMLADYDKRSQRNLYSNFLSARQRYR